MVRDAIGLYTGHIVAALPYWNEYVVNTEVGEVVAILGGTGSSRRLGHIGDGALPAGTTVIVAIPQNTHEQSKNNKFPAVILCAFDLWPIFTGDAKEDQTDFVVNESIPEALSNPNNNQLYNNFIKHMTLPILNQDRSYNRPLDAIPGDWYKTTAQGGGFLLSDFLASCGVSTDCGVHFFSENNAIEIFGRNFTIDTESFVRQLIHRGNDPLSIEDYAFTPAEGLGVPYDRAAFVSAENEDDDSQLKLIDPLQAGFFRRSVMGGGSVEGHYENIKTALVTDEDVFTYGTHVYPGMLQEMKRMDGMYRLRAAREIKFEKTGSIVIPVQKADPNTTDRPTDEAFEEEELEKADKTDTELKKEAFGLKSDDEVYALTPLLQEQFAEYEEQEIFFRGLRKDKGVWHFPSKEEVTQKVFVNTDDPTLPPLDDQKQEYTTDDIDGLLSEAIDVYPGRKVKIFKNSSVFMMSEDGGLIIGDGYGAEIRMSRGNVTISAAADVKVLPGRDYVQLAGGNSISKAGDRVEVASTRGSVALKAQENMQMVSGNEETGGMLTLENRSAQESLTSITEQQLRDGEAVGSGIVLKSRRSGVSMLGNFIYGGGLTTNNQNSENGVQSRSTNCDIYFNSGRGTVMMTGASGAYMFEDSLAMSMLRSSTGIYLSNSNAIYAATSSNILVASEVVVDKGQGSVEVPTLTSSGVDTRRNRLPRRSPEFIVQGNARTKDLGVAGSVSVQNGVIATDGCNPDPTATPVNVNLGNSRAEIASNTASSAATDAVTVSDRMVQRGIATEYGHSAVEFAFPDGPIYRAAQFEFVSTKWQRLLDTKNTWIENGLDHGILENETFPYPGREIYLEERKVFVKRSEDGTVERVPFTEYPVNVNTGERTT